ncbi:(S)-benzoin forming benzil reductase [Bacillaceae bacterium Marseille-Q3522]|nr:(S)-benzoin forming benzil reductase [Bacillaceae bacterium Marseille-Q3522]
MSLAIITGASRGLGASIAKRMLKEDIGIISLARNENHDLKKLAETSDLFYQFYACDFSDQASLESTIDKVASFILSSNPDHIYMFNNAGVVEPIHTAGNMDENLLLRNIQINLTAPLYICNELLKTVKNTEMKLDIVNVTSGAAKNPYHGWSAYCSTKAGVNMFTETVALELKNSGQPHRIIAFSPGIMDTEMQGVIRSSSKEAFVEIERFQGFKEKGSLRHPDKVADALVDLILLSDQVESGKVYNVNDLIK